MNPPNLYDILSELNTYSKNCNNDNDEDFSTGNTNVTDLLANIENDTDKRIINSSRANSNSTINGNGSTNNTNNKTTNKNEPFTLLEFNKFLTRTHCDENMKFFIMARPFLMQDDKKSMFSAPSSISTNSFEINFNLDGWNDTIYNIFIKVDSPLECNFPQRIRNLFDNCYQLNKPPRQAYIAQAVQHILNLLFDAYSKFLKYQLEMIEQEKMQKQKEEEEAAAAAAEEESALEKEITNDSDNGLTKSLSVATSTQSTTPISKLRNTNKVSSKQSKKVRNDNKKLYNVKSKSTSSRGNSTIRRHGTKSTSISPPPQQPHSTDTTIPVLKNMNLLSKGTRFLNKFKKSYF